MTAIALIFSYFSFHTPFPTIGSLSFLSATIITIGYGVKKIEILDRIRNKAWLVIPAFAIVLLGSIYFPTDMLHHDYKNAVPYLCFSTVGVLMVLQICQCMIEDTWYRKTLLYIGDRTMTILIWHFLSFKLVQLLIIYVENRDIEHLAIFPNISDSPYPWWLLYTVVGVAMPLGIDRLLQVIKIKLTNL